MIRDATLDDAEALAELDRALAADGRGMVVTVDQVMPASERGKRMAERHTLVADDAGVLGYAELYTLSPSRCRHVGLLALGVHPEAQRKGLGRALMNALVERAKEIGVERLELYVRADNHRARGLYRSLDFRLEGTRSRFIRLEDGSYVDDLTMVRFLERTD